MELKYLNRQKHLEINTSWFICIPLICAVTKIIFFHNSIFKRYLLSQINVSVIAVKSITSCINQIIFNIWGVRVSAGSLINKNM